MRLIDADEIRWSDHYDSDGNLSKYKVAYSDEMPPTVDAIPVRHGKWIRWRDLNGIKRCKCSECIVSYGNMDTPYCPNCGAKMDGERKEK